MDRRLREFHKSAGAVFLLFVHKCDNLLHQFLFVAELENPAPHFGALGFSSRSQFAGPHLPRSVILRNLAEINSADGGVGVLVFAAHGSDPLPTVRRLARGRPEAAIPPRCGLPRATGPQPFGDSHIESVAVEGETAGIKIAEHRSSRVHLYE